MAGRVLKPRLLSRPWQLAGDDERHSIGPWHWRRRSVLAAKGSALSLKFEGLHRAIVKDSAARNKEARHGGKRSSGRALSRRPAAHCQLSARVLLLDAAKTRPGLRCVASSPSLRHSNSALRRLLHSASSVFCLCCWEHPPRPSKLHTSRAVRPHDACKQRTATDALGAPCSVRACLAACCLRPHDHYFNTLLRPSHPLSLRCQPSSSTRSRHPRHPPVTHHHGGDSSKARHCRRRRLRKDLSAHVSALPASIAPSLAAVTQPSS